MQLIKIAITDLEIFLELCNLKNFNRHKFRYHFDAHVTSTHINRVLN